MPPAARAATRIVSSFAAALVLLLPALWNRFPLLQYDTGGYLARWFEGTLVVSRSTTYGLFLAAAAPLDFWPAVVLQAAAAVWVVGVLLRTHRFSVHPYGLPAVVAALAVATALPWLASVLLTDIFAGLAVLALHAAVVHGDRLSKPERVALVLFIAFAVSTHSATYAVLLGLCLVALAVSWLNAKLVPRVGLARGIVAMVLGAVMLLAGNYAVAKKIAWTPGGFGLAFGRMLQDGIVTRYLNDHCPDPTLQLCPYRNELPRDADSFLWGGGVFDKLGRFAGLGNEMRRIVLESLRDYPAMQIRTALEATARQLVTIGTGEGVLTTISHTYGIIERYTPAAVPAMRAARQQQGELDFTAAINKVDEPVGWAATALLPLLMFLGWRSAGFAELGALAATIALALLGNAAVCGVISNPHDRYGARMVWIAAFALTLAGWRAGTLLRKRLITLRSAISAATP
jgi:hypothetical protein